MLVDPQLTCFEPDTVGNMMRGLEYHRFFFDAGTSPLHFLSRCSTAVRAYIVVRATGLAYGVMQVLGVSQTPELIDIKFGMGNYVGNITLHLNIQNDCPSGGRSGV